MRAASLVERKSPRTFGHFWTFLDMSKNVHQVLSAESADRPLRSKVTKQLFLKHAAGLNK